MPFGCGPIPGSLSYAEASLISVNGKATSMSFLGYLVIINGSPSSLTSFRLASSCRSRTREIGSQQPAQPRDESTSIRMLRVEILLPENLPESRPRLLLPSEPSVDRRLGQE